MNSDNHNCLKAAVPWNLLASQQLFLACPASDDGDSWAAAAVLLLSAVRTQSANPILLYFGGAVNNYYKQKVEPCKKFLVEVEKKFRKPVN
jgi:hypothetical protein